MVETSTLASTEERVESTRCSVRVPLRPEKRPFTLEIIMCFTLNSADECAGSSFQVITEAGEVVVAMGWLLSQPWMRQDINRCNNYFYDREGISQCHPVTVLFASAIAFLSSRIR